MRKCVETVSHREWMIEMIREDREPAVELFREALESIDEEEYRAASLMALRDIAEACGELGAVAAKAGISRESLYRSLSPKGNPTLKTLIAVLNTMGLRLSVAPQKKAVKKPPAKAQKKKRRISKTAAASRRAA